MLRQAIFVLLLRSPKIFKVPLPQITEDVGHFTAIGVMKIVSSLIQHPVVGRITMATYDQDPLKMLLPELIRNVHKDPAQGIR